MKESIKSQKGIAAIVIVLIVVISIVAGGSTFLGVRALITKEPFLQPFENMGLMEIEDEDEKEEKESKKEDKEENKEDKEENKEEKEDKKDKEDNDDKEDKKENKKDKETNKGESSSLLIEEIEEDGVKCHTIKIDLEEVAEGVVPIIEDLLSLYMFASIDGTTSEDTATMENTLSAALDTIPAIFAECEIILDCYAKGNDIKQLIITIPYERMVKNLYSEMDNLEEFVQALSPTASLGLEFDSYEAMLADFEEEVLSGFTTDELRASLSEEDIDSKYSEIIKTAECTVEDGKIQISFNLSSIKIDDYIGEFRDELEAMGIDPDNLVESAVETWNAYIDEEGYNGAIEEVYSTVIGTYEMFNLY